jgi:hypothetical protein
MEIFKLLQNKSAKLWSIKVYKKWGVTDLPPLKEYRPDIR